MPSPTTPSTLPLSRRRWLAAGAGLSASVLAVSHSAAAPAAPATGAHALTASTTEGPYYLADPPVRADLAAGLAGVPLELHFAVVDAVGRALPALPVDVWHCDSQGFYSGFAGQGDGGATDTTGQTFLRGRWPTDAAGVARFRTVYPGWYMGRTTHIHLKVWNGARQLLTTQFFLPDALSEFLYTQMPAYRRARVRDVLNSNDGIALEAGDTVLGAVHERGDRYVASLTLVVDPAADTQPDRPPAPPGAGEGGRRGPPPDGTGPGRGPGGPGGPGRQAALEGEARIAALVPHAAR